ncbi:NAD(P)-dependent oxidoreductase [Cellulomonas sp. ICMP 17802]|uniref:NAD(P)-dependent oxidoreductase n=1 Tax=Cellulomonas sp. ICMP 17802 TaxID=3239199 RepID=UPI00351BBDCA
MKLTIIAATGGIGRQLLEQATAAGHDVTAVVRDPSRLPSTTARVVTVDLAKDTAALQNAVAGADAVLSGLGARTKADEGIATRGTRAIVDAMRATGSARLVVVSAAPIGTVPSPDTPHPPAHDAGDGFFMRHLFSRIPKVLFATHYADLAAMEDVVRASGLDWTIARPPKLTNKPLSGQYRTALDQNARGGWSISRADVAHLMLRMLDQPETVRHVVGAAT